MTSGTYSRTTMMILCGIFAAVTAICSLITIPLGLSLIHIYTLSRGSGGLQLIGHIGHLGNRLVEAPYILYELSLIHI